MLEHEIKNKVLTIGNRKGQTVYYAYPKFPVPADMLSAGHAHTD